MGRHFIEDLSALVGDALSQSPSGSDERRDIMESLCDHLALTIMAEGKRDQIGPLADQMIERLHRGLAVMIKASPATLAKMRAEIRAMQNLMGENADGTESRQ